MYETTAPEARAIRNADSLCFDHRPDGTGVIRAIKRAENSDTGFEQTITVPVETSRVQNYGSGTGPYSACAVMLWAQTEPRVRTVTRRIKTGSRVAFEWSRDDNSPVTTEAGVVVDHLDVVIGNGRVTDTIRVSTFIGLDNSARMIRNA